MKAIRNDTGGDALREALAEVVEGAPTEAEARPVRDRVAASAE
jgi:hypothetical protein